MLSDEELAAAEAAIRSALASGDTRGLRILGYGEISTVVAFEGAAGDVALKRLPPFDGVRRFEAYRALFEEYLARLGEAGVRVVPSELRSLEPESGALVAYCLQPVLDGDRLGPKVFAGSGEAVVAKHAGMLFDLILGTVGPRLGLDAQLANWTLADGGWTYLDVTTPFLRDAEGRDRLDSDLFLDALPWVLRGFVRRFVLRGITDAYFDPRRVSLDILGNLHKERLERHLPAMLDVVNPRLARPISEAEVRSHYARDARLWTALLALRRLDRVWQRRVRRRPYPFLLPGKIRR